MPRVTIASQQEQIMNLMSERDKLKKEKENYKKEEEDMRKDMTELLCNNGWSQYCYRGEIEFGWARLFAEIGKLLELRESQKGRMESRMREKEIEVLKKILRDNNIVIPHSPH